MFQPGVYYRADLIFEGADLAAHLLHYCERFEVNISPTRWNLVLVRVLFKMPILL